MRFLLVALALTVPLAAQTPPNNELGLVFGYAAFKEDVGPDSSADTAGLSYNRYWTKAISTRFSAIEYGIRTFRAHTPEGDPLDMRAFSAALEYHARRESLLAPYAGAGVALVSSTLGSRFVEASADAEVTGFVTAGVDVNLFHRFAAGFDVTYMPYRPTYPAVGPRELDPVTTSATLKYRW